VSEVLTVTFADDSSLNGRSTSLSTGTVTVQGGVYRSAVGVLRQGGSLFAGGGTLNLGSVRVGGLFAAQTLDVANTAQTGDAFSEKLNASLVASGSGLTSGSVSLLAAGSVSAGALSFGFDPNTAMEAGLKSGTAVVSFVTDGDGTSQLGTLGVGSQSVRLTGKVFRTASGTLTGGTSVTLAAVREGGTFVSGTVAVRNTAAADGYSEKLNVRLSGASGDASIATGSLNLLAAGSANASTLRVTLGGTATVTAGAKSGTVGLQYLSDGQGTSGLAALDLNAETLSISGNVYRLATGSFSTGTLASTVSLGNIRAGGAVANTAITFYNTASDDGFSDLLRVSTTGTGGFGATGSGSLALSGGSNALVSIGYTGATTVGGAKNGVLTFAQSSVGQAGTGLANVALSSSTLSVTANVFRMAAGTLSQGGTTFANNGTLRLTGIREGGTFATTLVDIRNVAVADAFSEKLNAVLAGTQGFAEGSGSASALVAGGTSAGALRLGLGSNVFSTAGVQTGAVTIAYETDGAGTSELGTLAAGSQTLQLSGTVYRLATGTLNSGTLTLASTRVGSVFASGGVSVANASSGDGYSEKLKATLGSAGGDAVITAGTLNLLAGGTSDATTLRVTLGGTATQSVGVKTGTVAVNYASDGTGTTGLAAIATNGADTLQISGTVYRAASGSLSVTTLNLGNIRANETVRAGSFSLTNTAATGDGYSDLLRYNGTSPSGFEFSGGSATLVAGSSTLLGVSYQGSTAEAGVKSGTLTLGLTSVGQAGSGLSDLTLASQTVEVRATVFRKAAGELQRDGAVLAEGGTVSLAAIREGGVFTAVGVDVRNTAVADVFSEKLNAAIGGTGGFAVASGVVQQLGAGSLASGTLSLGFGGTVFNAAGRQAGSVNVGFETDGAGTSGLGRLSLGNQTVQLVGDVYRLAVGSLGGGGVVQLNAIREGGTFGEKSVAVSNVASAEDRFSDDLVAAVGATTGTVTAVATPAVVAAGETVGNGLRVGYGGTTASAGAVSGTAVIEFKSSGQSGTGLGVVDAAVRSGTVTVSGEIYRLAVGSLGAASVDLGAIRERGAFTPRTIAVSNVAASNDGFSDDLAAAVVSTPGNVSVVGGVERLSAGSSSASALTLGFAGDVGAAGVVSGTVVVGFTSLGQIGTGLAAVSPLVGSGSVQVSGTIYREAVLTLNGTDAASVDLGRVHAGGSFAAGSLLLGNGAFAGDAFSDRLRVVSSGGAAEWSLSGGTSVLLDAGSSAQLGIAYSASTAVAGLRSGTISLAPTSVASAGVTLGDLGQSVRTVQVQGFVYSGQGVWTGADTGVGAWTDWNNWQAEGGRPGLDGVLSRGKDSASIVSGSAALTVSLPAQLVELQSLTLAGAGGVTLSGTAGSGLALGASGTLSSSVVANGGAHTVSAAVSLSSPAVLSIGTGARLTISGVVTGGADASLTKEGEGTLFLAQGYTYSGATFVNAGKLELGLSAGVDLEQGRRITLGANARLVFIGLTADLRLPNTEIIGNDEWVTSANSQYNVEWKGGSTVKRVGPGEVLDLGTLGSNAKIELSGGGTLSFLSGGTVRSNNIVAGGTVGVRVFDGGSLKLSGVISNGSVGGVQSVGSVVKLEDGKLVLSGTNTYSGGTEVRGGTLELQNSRGAGTGAVSVGTAGVLALNAGVGAPMTFANALSGTGTLEKSGLGTVVMSGGSNTFGGRTTIGSGTLEVRENGALGTSVVSVGVDAALRLSPGAGTTMTLANTVSGPGSGSGSGSGSVVLDGAGTFAVDGATLAGAENLSLKLNAGMVALSGSLNVAVPVTVSGDVAFHTGGGVATFGGTLSGGGTLNVTGVVGGGVNVAVGGSVTFNGGTLTGFEKRGAGELTLGSGAVVTGNAAQVGAGTLKVTSNDTLAGVSILNVGTSTGSGARLDVSQVTGGLVVGGSVGGVTVPQLLKGSGTIRGVVKLGRGATIAPGNSIGKQKIDGDLQVGQGALYQVEYTMSGTLVNDLNDSDLLSVVAATGAGTGMVELNGGIVDPVAYLPKERSKGGNILTTFGQKARFKILEASGGVTGQFEGVRQSAALRATLVYASTGNAGTLNNTVNPVPSRAVGSAALGANDPVVVYLELERASYESLGRNSGGARKQLAEVGMGLDLLVKAAAYEKAIEDIITQFDALPMTAGSALVTLSNAEVPPGAGAAAAAGGVAGVAAASTGGVTDLTSVLYSIFPETFAEMYTLSLSRVQDVQKTVSDRLNLLGTAITSVSEQEVLSLATGTGGEWNAWTNGYGSFRSKSANQAAGEGGSSVSTFGDVTGVERRFGRATFGVMGGAGSGNTQFNRTGASVQSTSWHMGMYLSMPVTQRLFADVSGFYGEVDNVIQQKHLSVDANGITTRPGRAFMETQEWLLQVGVGGQMAREGSRWSLVPSARLAYTGMHFGKSRMDGFDGLQLNSGTLGIRTRSKWNATGLSRVGLDVAREAKLLRMPVRVTGSAAWVHDFNAAPRALAVAWNVLQQDSWSVSSGRSTSDMLRVGGALELGVGDRRTLRFYGEQEFLQGKNVFRGGVNFTIGF
jgi:autotransporter-associated beta strand protein